MSQEKYYGNTHIFTDRIAGGVITLKAGVGETLNIESNATSLEYKETSTNPTPSLGSTIDLVTTDTAIVAAGSQQGFTVAIDGDYLAVGNPYDTVSNAISQGSVQIYKKSGSGWSSQQLIRPSVNPNVCNPEWYGVVAMSGSYLMINHLADGEGGFVFYARSGSTYVQEAVIEEPYTPFDDPIGQMDLQGEYYATLKGYETKSYFGQRAGGTWTPTESPAYDPQQPISVAVNSSGVHAVGLSNSTVIVYQNNYSTVLRTITSPIYPRKLRIVDNYLFIAGDYSGNTKVAIYGIIDGIMITSFDFSGTFSDFALVPTHFVVSTTSSQWIYQNLYSESGLYSQWTQQATTSVANVRSVALSSLDLVYGIPTNNSNEGLVKVTPHSVSNSSLLTLSKISVDENGIDLFSVQPIEIKAHIPNVTSTNASLIVPTVSSKVSLTENLITSQLNVNSTTDSSSKTTGSFIVSGGIGVAKNVYCEMLTANNPWCSVKPSTSGSQTVSAFAVAELVGVYSTSSFSTNQSSVFSYGSGRITVSMAGLYFVFFSFNQDNAPVQYALCKNGVTGTMINATSNGTANYNSSTTMIYLNAGDQLSIVVYNESEFSTSIGLNPHANAWYMAKCF